MQLPVDLLQSLQGIIEFDEQSFIEIHKTDSDITSVRLNPLKIQDINSLSFSDAIGVEKIPWSNYGYYLSERPSFTFDPLFHAGCYYVQEASSMFLEQAIFQAIDVAKQLKVLDLSAAPGGKSTHLQSILNKDSLLVCNEVIRSRANILKDNIIKWGGGNVVVTNNDPVAFQQLPAFFDVMVVDAPCSGSGLFRKDEGAINHWSLQNVALCSQRQKRILADVLPALKQDGVLIYSTCSYSVEEDEAVVNWLAKEFNLESIRLSIKTEWGITETVADNNFGYRFWPYKVDGEGFFLSVFRKKDLTSSPKSLTKNKLTSATKSELQLLEEIANIKNGAVLKFGDQHYFWPAAIFDAMLSVVDKMNVMYSGTQLGQLMKNGLMPAHALALSPLLKETIKPIELPKQEAINYLSRKEIVISSANSGWNIVTYLQHPLGWVKVLPQRINNYYPKELRILK